MSEEGQKNLHRALDGLDRSFQKEPVERGMLWLERKWMLRKPRKHRERNATIEQAQ